MLAIEAKDMPHTQKPVDIVVRCALVRSAILQTCRAAAHASSLCGVFIVAVAADEVGCICPGSSVTGAVAWT